MWYSEGMNAERDFPQLSGALRGNTKLSCWALAGPGRILAMLVIGIGFVLAWTGAAHASGDVAETYSGLVGVGGSLFEFVLYAAVYVVSFGFFIFLACSWTGVKSTLGEAFGAAVFVAVFTVVIYGAHVFARPYLDPHDPMLSKAALVLGLVLAGPLAIKTTYEESFVGAFKTFGIAAILTGFVMGAMFFILQALQVTS